MSKATFFINLDAGSQFLFSEKMDHSEDPEELRSYSMNGVSTHQHLEIDGVVSDGSPDKKVNQNWQLGRPWFVGASNSMTSQDQPPSENARYFGGIMKSEGEEERQDRKSTRKTRQGLISRQIHRIKSDDESSLSKFTEGDWTPPDSSYGAACPVCGWIPKHVRQKIEFSLILILALVFLWAVIATTMHVSNARKNAELQNATGYDSFVFTDDFYVENTDDNGNADYQYYGND